MAFNGHYHVHLYPTLGPFLRKTRPDLVHIDEEPYNLATWHALRAAHQAGARGVFFTWQNLEGTLPLPFRLLQAEVLHHVDGGIAGNQDAATIMRRAGFTRPLAVIPQFGFDPALFIPRPAHCPHPRRHDRPFVIGCVSRLEEFKGLLVLVRAVAELARRPPDRAPACGTGSLRGALEALAAELGIGEKVIIRGQVPSTQMPALYHDFDALALPSLTLPRWKEQFGRVLVEAMLCEVPVVASDSGELPNVVGDAGMVVPEGDVAALTMALQRLIEDRDLRQHIGVAGRRRALEHYTMAAVARDTWTFISRCFAMNAPLYGVWLALEGWPCLVVGGGEVATRRVRGLVECKARVQVVTPEMTAELEQLATEGTIVVHRRVYASGDAMGMHLVIAATSSADINAIVSHDAHQAGALVNSAGDASSGDFHVAAVVRQGPIALALGTGGISPTAARALREWLSASLTPDFGRAVELLGEARGNTRFARAVEQAAAHLAHGEAAAAVAELTRALQ